MEFVPFQTANLERIAPGLTMEMASQTLHFVRSDGRRFRGARATFETLRRLPGVWGILGVTGSFLPLSLLAEPFYRIFASHRGTISQLMGLNRCEVPLSDR